MSDRRSAFTRRHLIAGVGSLALAGCLSQDDPADDDIDPGSPLGASVEPEPIVTGLDVPWDVAFAPDGPFVTERPGRLGRVEDGDVTTLVEFPNAREDGEGGVLGVAVHPDYPDPAAVYVYYTTEEPGSENRVVRLDPTADEPAGTVEPVLEGVPAATIHNGGRIAFGPEGDLWVLTGDANDAALSQETDSLAGSVLRLTPDGDPAADTGLDDPRIYTHGHRNPQGIDWLPDGTPVITEHGPSAHDEVSRLEPGGNYGWPDARDGDEYPDTGYARPVVNTGPDETWAPSGASFYTGGAVPEWQDHLLVGGLVSRQLIVVALTDPEDDRPPLDGNATRYDEDWMDDVVATAYPVFRDELGRIRHAVEGPDGDVYLLTSNRDGRASGEFPREHDDVLARVMAE